MKIVQWNAALNSFSVFGLYAATLRYKQAQDPAIKLLPKLINHTILHIQYKFINVTKLPCIHKDAAR